MNKYILMLGVAAVSIGSYCAHADNSATMTVTAIVTHDVSLTNVNDIDLGTITINPASNDELEIYYNLDGTVKSKSDPVTAATDATLGTFTANIANPSACDGSSNTCGGLSVHNIMSFFAHGLNGCGFAIVYDSENKFKVVPTECFAQETSDVTSGFHIKAFTISYTPE
ncbi:MAG: hypothetical protein IJ689_03180 [Alphaproteobacteria bacterium]|nr:hypothetical protein [Alphaproteobacteria bacterium]